MATKRSVFAWAPLRALMKKHGAIIASREAVKTLMEHLEIRAKAITEQAIKVAKHSKRKKVTKGDINLALDVFK